MHSAPPTTIVFSPHDDIGFQAFQKLVMTLLPGATSIRGIPSIDADGQCIFKIDEIRDNRNHIMWSRPEHGHGQLEELLLLWESRIYTCHELLINQH